MLAAIEDGEGEELADGSADGLREFLDDSSATDELDDGVELLDMLLKASCLF